MFVDKRMFGQGRHVRGRNTFHHPSLFIQKKCAYIYMKEKQRREEREKNIKVDKGLTKGITY